VFCKTRGPEVAADKAPLKEGAKKEDVTVTKQLSGKEAVGGSAR
jgi:hypothetical protein